jgi:hypothetical protein
VAPHYPDVAWGSVALVGIVVVVRVISRIRSGPNHPDRV